jgi:hypothetical protein
LSIFAKDFMCRWLPTPPYQSLASIGILAFSSDSNFVVDVEFDRAKSGTPNEIRRSAHGVGCSGSHPWRRISLPHLEDATPGLDSGSCTPSGDEGTREDGIAEVDREGVIQYTACACATRSLAEDETRKDLFSITRSASCSRLKIYSMPDTAFQCFLIDKPGNHEILKR